MQIFLIDLKFKKMNKILIWFVLPLFLVFNSCNDKAEKEKEERQAYITENNITVEPAESGLYYIETKEGNIKQAKAGDIVTVHYTGKFLNGDEFDSSRGSFPIQFKLGVGQVIPGWDEGIAYMKIGGKATFIVPSELAYGAEGKDRIPGYATLIFDVELIDVISSKKDN